MLLNCDVGEDCESPLDSKEIQPVHLGESEKVGWKLDIQKTKIMASGPIT